MNKNMAKLAGGSNIVNLVPSLSRLVNFWDKNKA